MKKKKFIRWRLWFLCLLMIPGYLFASPEWLVAPVSSDNQILLRKSLIGVFSQDQLDIATADQLMGAFMHVSASGKSEFLWMLATHCAGTHSSIKFGYLVDSIAVINDPTIVVKMVHFYRTQQLSQMDKIHLLSDMAQLVGSKSIIAASHRSAQARKEIKIVQELFQDILTTSEDREELRQAIMLYPNIAPPDQAYPLANQARVRAAKLFAKPILDQREQIFQDLLQATATKQRQRQLMPQLLKNMTHESEDRRKKFNRMLYLWLKQVHLSDINPEIKPELLRYLSQNRLTVQQGERRKFGMIEISSSVMLSAKLRCASDALVQNCVNKAIMNTVNTEQLAAIIIGANSQTLASLGHANLELIRHRIESVPRKRGRLPRLYMDAIFRINACRYETGR